jgi:hypothetical protein
VYSGISPIQQARNFCEKHKLPTGRKLVAWLILEHDSSFKYQQTWTDMLVSLVLYMLPLLLLWKMWVQSILHSTPCADLICAGSLINRSSKRCSQVHSPRRVTTVGLKPKQK